MEVNVNSITTNMKSEIYRRYLKGGKVKMSSGKIRKAFTRQDHFITELSSSLPYEPWSDYTCCHFGQLKLILGEIAFINMFWDPKKHPNPHFLMIGAAPGHHYGIMAKMFPKITFHLYDKSPITLKERSLNIRVNQRYFTEADAEKWATQSSVFLVSDIRVVNSKDREVFEKQVMSDMRMQESWVDVVKPVAASLKFRLPYVDPNSSGEMVDNIISYLDGFVFRQPWQKLSTNECRLFISPQAGRYVKRKWSSIMMQDQAYFHNRYYRVSEFENPFTFDYTPVSGEELTNDYDSIATVNILRDYIKKMTGVTGKESETMSLYWVILESINDNRSESISVSKIRSSDNKSTTHRSVQEIARFKSKSSLSGVR